MDKRKILIAISSTLVVSGVGYFIYSKIRNKKEVNQIHAILDDRTKAYGSIEDFSDVFAGRGYINNIESKVKNVIFLLPDYVTQYRKLLNSAISGAGTDEDAIKVIFRKMKDKVQIAQVAESYQKNYGVNLLEDLKNDMDVDSADMKELLNIMITKPAYRVSK